MPIAGPVTDRPIRVAVVGLGPIAELMLPAYLTRDDIAIVAACDRDPDRLARWRPELTDAARANGTMLRILEDYVYFPPIVRLRDVVRSGEIGDAVGLHMKIVNTGRGGWDVLPQSWEWQLDQTRDGRGMLVFDHGWHQLALATWLFGPITRVFAWIGSTEVAPGYALDAPASLVWEHATGLRGGLDLTLAPDTYFRSDFYSCDERVEVTGSRGSVRCNRISASGRQEPSVEVYRDGETREFHALADGGDADTTEHVMRALIAALDSARLGKPVDVDHG